MQEKALPPRVKITKRQQEALDWIKANIPAENWFDQTRLPYTFTRPGYICNQLHLRNHLYRDVSFVGTTWMYKIRPDDE